MNYNLEITGFEEHGRERNVASLFLRTPKSPLPLTMSHHAEIELNSTGNRNGGCDTGNTCSWRPGTVRRQLSWESQEIIVSYRHHGSV